MSTSLEELKLLLRELANIDGMDTGTIKSQIELEMRLHAAEEALNKSERFLSDKTDENKRLKEENNQLTSKYFCPHLFPFSVDAAFVLSFLTIAF